MRVKAITSPFNRALGRRGWPKAQAGALSTPGQAEVFAGKQLRGERIFCLLAATRATAKGKYRFSGVFRPNEVVDLEFWLNIELLTLLIGAVYLVIRVDLVLKQ